MDADVGHSCGLFGVFGSWSAPAMVCQGLQALQHRGQESAGIASCDQNDIRVEKDVGLVSQVFDTARLDLLTNPVAIGHVRYSTTGGPDPRNAQPLKVDYRSGPVAVGHNGDLTNKRELRREGEQLGATFMTSSDTEVIVNLLARAPGESFEEQLHHTLRRLQGAFSLLLLRPGEIHAVRDPYGFRPLSIGRAGEVWIVSSETCAFSLFDAEHVRDVEPGEHVTITRDGLASQRFAEAPHRARCVFEHVYFARPDSLLFGRNVHRVRVELGRRLARENPADADLVIAVPESGNSAAQGFSEESGLPLDRGFIKNHYVGRTFIKPDQTMRASSVRLKLNAVPEVVGGRRLVVVDDSIIRGTTSLGRIQTLRQAGAEEVHLRISCPPTAWPCFYGIDFPTRKELIAASNTVDRIADFLKVDSLGYLSLEGLLGAVAEGGRGFCHACFTGRYPASTPRGALEEEEPLTGPGPGVAVRPAGS